MKQIILHYSYRLQLLKITILILLDHSLRTYLFKQLSHFYCCEETWPRQFIEKRVYWGLLIVSEGQSTIIIWEAIQQADSHSSGAVAKILHLIYKLKGRRTDRRKEEREKGKRKRGWQQTEWLINWQMYWAYFVIFKVQNSFPWHTSSHKAIFPISCQNNLTNKVPSIQIHEPTEASLIQI